MKLTLKTATCSVLFIASTAWSQTSSLPKVQVHSYFENPLYYFTTFYEQGQNPSHGTTYHILGYQYNVDVLTDTYGINANQLSYGTTSISDGYGGYLIIPIVSLGSKQCVAVVQLLSNAKHTSKWRAKIGDKLHPNMNFQTPFVAATLKGGEDSHGLKYSNSSTKSHVGIVFQYNTNGVWILEQNWEGTGSHPVGRLAMRYMMYSSNSQGAHQSNAENYYVVHQLP